MGDTDKLIAKTYLQMQRLTAEVAMMRSHLEGKPDKKEGWMASRKAASALENEGVKSTKHLSSLRLQGAFSESKGEIRNVSRGNRPTWEYNVPKCRKALQRYFSTLLEN
jgi:hypothetical protein